MLFWGLTREPNLNIPANTETYMGFKVNGKNVYCKRINIETAQAIGYGEEVTIQDGVSELLTVDMLYKGNDSGQDWFPFPCIKQNGTGEATTMDYTKRLHVCVTNQNKLWIAGSKDGASFTVAVKGYVMYTKVND